ncbi:MAG: hypothetical protein P8O69_13610, partial [Amylibacter sp.]|nr:hypothetical protein [Amylibacter sp.]
MLVKTNTAVSRELAIQPPNTLRFEQSIYDIAVFNVMLRGLKQLERHYDRKFWGFAEPSDLDRPSYRCSLLQLQMLVS